MCLWEKLKNTNKPIMLYGFGDGADKILKVCKEKGIEISGIFASDNFKKNIIYQGFKVYKYSEVPFDDFIILVAFGTYLDGVIQEIHKMSENYELYAPDVPVYGSGVFDDEFLKTHKQEMDKAYNHLEDEISKSVFMDTLNFKLSGELKYLRDTDKDEVFNNILKLNANETFVDLGAYNGDTIREFLKYTNNKYEKIIAFEPDIKNFRKLNNFLNDNNVQNVTTYNVASNINNENIIFGSKSSRGSSVSQIGTEIKSKCVDSLGLAVSLLKMDVEGFEKETLLGAKNTLKKYKPKLNVAAYHRNEDFFSLINLIKDINPEYKIYLRHHPYIPAWDTNIYAV